MSEKVPIPIVPHPSGGLQRLAAFTCFYYSAEVELDYIHPRWHFIVVNWEQLESLSDVI